MGSPVVESVVDGYRLDKQISMETITKSCLQGHTSGTFLEGFQLLGLPAETFRENQQHFTGLQQLPSPIKGFRVSFQDSCAMFPTIYGNHVQDGQYLIG
jgi:hypothetical protein